MQPAKTITQNRSVLGNLYRNRCNRHGLVIVSDGACLLCIDEQRKRGTRTLLLLLAGVAAVVLAVIAFGHQSNHTSAESRKPTTNGARIRQSKSGSHINNVADPMNNHVVTHAVDRDIGEGVNGSQNPIAEDRYLGTSQKLQPSMAVAPPLPPRAPTDSQVRPADNAADFDLPHQ